MIVFVLGKVWFAFGVGTGVDCDGLPVDESQLINNIKNTWHYLQFKSPWLIAMWATWRQFALGVSVDLGGPHWFNEGFFAV
jgi:hypothetical protein